MMRMRKTVAEFVRKGCSNAQITRPVVAIERASKGGVSLNDSKVFGSVFPRWGSNGVVENTFSIGGRRIGCRDGSAGGAHLRLFSSENSDPESSALVSEERFHSIANDTLDMLQEKIEAYGEDLDVNGFDLDYSDGVMTVRLGELGTYVLNKQTPNRQLWLSSPVSGPARFDWVMNGSVWVYRRNKAELVSLLELELSKLLGSPVTLKD